MHYPILASLTSWHRHSSGSKRNKNWFCSWALYIVFVWILILSWNLRLFKLRRVSYCLLDKKVNICLFNSKGLLSRLSENKVVKIFPIKSIVSYWKHFIFITVLNGILCPLELEHGLIGMLNGQRITQYI